MSFSSRGQFVFKIPSPIASHDDPTYDMHGSFISYGISKKLGRDCSDKKSIKPSNIVFKPITISKTQLQKAVKLLKGYFETPFYI